MLIREQTVRIAANRQDVRVMGFISGDDG